MAEPVRPPAGTGAMDSGTGVTELERTLESLREESEIAHVLLSLSGVLAEVRSVEETLDIAVKVVAEIMEADRAYAVTTTESAFDIRAHKGFDHRDLEELRSLLAGAEGAELLASASDDMGPVIVEDAPGHPRTAALVAAGRKMASFIGIPLARWGQPFGTLGLEFERPRHFGQKDIALARGIARQIGVAIANARRFRLLGGLRAFGLSLASKLSLAGVINQVTSGSSALLMGDGAAMYLLDSTNRALVSAGGLDETADLSDRFRIIDLDRDPWRALLQGRSILVRDLGDDDAPLSAVAAPIPGEGTPMLGAVVVFFRRMLTLAPDETEALSVLAGQAGMAIENANRFERQRRVARSLQAGLLSTEMPQLEGFELAAVYEPASGEADIGGDFYDAFMIGEGQFAVVVGDVSGKGAEAAARTSMAKYMLRAFAMRNARPSSALFHLNNALAHDLEADRFATLVYGVFEVEARRWTIARGGHPPPLVYRSSTGRVEVYEEIQGSILGAFEDQQYQQESFTMSPGDVLLLYTDGLIEARSPTEGFYGRRRIEQALSRYAPDLPAHELTLRLYQDALEFGVVADDTVVLALRCLPGDSA